MRVVVRVATPADRSLLQRTRGQSSDLNVELVETTEPPIEARLADQLAAARKLAATHRARLVLWFDTTLRDEEPGALLVYFSIPADRRAFVRSVGDASARAEGGDPSSAALEEAALVVRSALRALAGGATVGVTLGRPLDEPAMATPPAPAEAPPRAAAAPRPRRADTAHWVSTAHAGWANTFYGQSSAGQQGTVARAGIAYGRFRGGLALSLTLPAQLRDPRATLTLSRRAAGVFAGAALAPSENIQFTLGLGVGAVAFVRTTHDVAPGGAPSPPAATFSPYAGPEIVTSFVVRWGATAWSLAPSVGVDIVPLAPSIGYDVGGHFLDSHPLWKVQPRLALLLGVTGL
jgi:hypothetical protein